jgi:hypothetical protein
MISIIEKKGERKIVDLSQKYIFIHLKRIRKNEKLIRLDVCRT